MTRLVFLDAETTSLDDTRGEVWEIGAIVRDPGKPDAEYLWQIRPTLEAADPMSLRVGRYYERRVLEMKAPGEAAEMVRPGSSDLLSKGEGLRLLGAAAVAEGLADLLAAAHVVGAVPDFDFRFLRKFMAQHNECWTAHYHLIDIEALVVGWLHNVTRVDWLNEGLSDGLLSLPWRSADLYRAVGVDPSKYEAHTALGDARLVRDVYDVIIGAAQALPKGGQDG